MGVRDSRLLRARLRRDLGLGRLGVLDGIADRLFGFDILVKTILGYKGSFFLILL